MLRYSAIPARAPSDPSAPFSEELLHRKLSNRSLASIPPSTNTSLQNFQKLLKLLLKKNRPGISMSKVDQQLTIEQMVSGKLLEPI